jgi:hypothetical protein
MIRLKNQPAQFFVFFVDVGNCFFEVAVDCIGLKENVCKVYECGRFMNVHLLLNRLRQAIGLDL